MTDVSTTCAEAIFRVKLNLTLKMASAQVVETSVTNNSPSQDPYHPDDLFQSRITIILQVCILCLILYCIACKASFRAAHIFHKFTAVCIFLIERLSMTFTANGKRQGGPRDQFFPRFLTFAGCSLPFSTRREVVSRR